MQDSLVGMDVEYWICQQNFTITEFEKYRALTAGRRICGIRKKSIACGQVDQASGVG